MHIWETTRSVHVQFHAIQTIILTMGYAIRGIEIQSDYAASASPAVVTDASVLSGSVVSVGSPGPGVVSRLFSSSVSSCKRNVSHSSIN